MTSQTTNQRLSEYAPVLLIISLLAFIISWLAPTYSDAKGYQAYQETYDFLFQIGDKWSSQDKVIDKIMLILMGISPHTNYIFVIATLVLLFNREGINPTLQSFLCNLLIFCFLINLCWLYVVRDSLQMLHIGYYLWAASFFITAFVGYNLVPAKEKPAAPTS